MSVEVQTSVLIIDTRDGERMYSKAITETVVPARHSEQPDPEVIMPLLAQKVTSLTGECRDNILEQLDQTVDMLEPKQ